MTKEKVCAFGSVVAALFIALGGCGEAPEAGLTEPVTPQFGRPGYPTRVDEKGLERDMNGRVLAGPPEARQEALCFPFPCGPNPGGLPAGSPPIALDGTFRCEDNPFPFNGEALFLTAPLNGGASYCWGYNINGPAPEAFPHLGRYNMNDRIHGVRTRLHSADGFAVAKVCLRTHDNFIGDEGCIPGDNAINDVYTFGTSSLFHTFNLGL